MAAGERGTVSAVGGTAMKAVGAEVFDVRLGGGVAGLDACLTHFIIQEWFPHRASETCRLVEHRLEPRASGGCLPVPTALGLGMELDEAVLWQHECIRLP
jgi:hypothetical protein